MRIILNSYQLICSGFVSSMSVILERKKKQRQTYNNNNFSTVQKYFYIALHASLKLGKRLRGPPWFVSVRCCEMQTGVRRKSPYVPRFGKLSVTRPAQSFCIRTMLPSAATCAILPSLECHVFAFLWLATGHVTLRGEVAHAKPLHAGWWGNQSMSHVTYQIKCTYIKACLPSFCVDLRGHISFSQTHTQISLGCFFFFSLCLSV